MINFSSDVPYSRSVLFHIRLSDFTHYTLSESFNAANNIPYVILSNIARVFVTELDAHGVHKLRDRLYARSYLDFFFIEIAVCKYCVC